MLERRKARIHSKREESILSECIKPENKKLVTHIEIMSASFVGILRGVYLFSPTSNIIYDLDGDHLGSLTNYSMNLGCKRNKINLWSHTPTVNKMLADGRLVDNRTKTEEKEEEDNPQENIKESVNTTRRSLGI